MSDIPHGLTPEVRGRRDYYRGENINPWPESSKPGREWQRGYSAAQEAEASHLPVLFPEILR